MYIASSHNFINCKRTPAKIYINYTCLQTQMRLGKDAWNRMNTKNCTGLIKSIIHEMGETTFQRCKNAEANTHHENCVYKKTVTNNPRRNFLQILIGFRLCSATYICNFQHRNFLFQWLAQKEETLRLEQFLKCVETFYTNSFVILSNLFSYSSNISSLSKVYSRKNTQRKTKKSCHKRNPGYFFSPYLN